jgi:glycosyltransferase involved in cell wall biosynthesis
LSAESLKELKEKCEVLLLPSLSEGFPTIIIESMARGLCVAATGVGAVPKVIDEHTGWFLKPGNSKSIKDIMKAIIRTPAKTLHAKQMACYKKVLVEYQWQSMVNQLVSHLDTAAHDYRKRIAREQPKKY